jgi:hypothetical protein
MSGSSDFDRQIRAWLDLGPTQLSDVALDDARAEVHRTRQRHALRVPRRFQMSQSSRLLAAAVAGLAAVILVGVGLRVVSNPSNLGNTVPSGSIQPSFGASPSTSPTPRPTFSFQASFPKMEPVVTEGPLTLLWKASRPTPSGVATGAPAIDPTGRIWVPSGFDSTFWIFSPSGKYLESWGSKGSADGLFDFVDTTGGVRQGYGAIAFASDGGFWVADTGNHRVQHFDKDRTFLDALPDMGTPVAISVDADGHFFVDDASRREIREYNSSMVYILTFAHGLAGPYVAQGGRGWIVTNALPDGRPGFTSYKPDGSYQGSLDMSAACDWPAGIAQGLIACMTGSDASAKPAGLIRLDDTGSGAHFWPTGGAGVATTDKGDAVYITYPGSPELRKYTLP